MYLLAKKLTLTACGVLLTACQSIPTNSHDFCLASKGPIRLKKSEIATMSDESAKQINTYNQVGIVLCGWNP